MASKNTKTTDVYTKKNRRGEFTHCRGATKPCGLLVDSDHAALLCEICNTWYHADCMGYSQELYDNISAAIDDVSWYCFNCKRSLKTLDTKIKAVNLRCDELATDVKELKENMKANVKKINTNKSSSDNRFASVEERLRKLEKNVTEIRSTADPEVVVKKIEESTKKLEEESKKRHIEYSNTMYEQRNIQYKSKNLIISGLPESQNSNAKKNMKEDFRKIMEVYRGKVDDLTPDDVAFAKRLGTRKENPTSILVRFNNVGMRTKLLINNRGLKFTDGVQEHTVYVSIDRTRTQNKKLYDLRKEKKRRMDKGENDWVIRNYKLVKNQSNANFAEFFRADTSEDERASGDERASEEDEPNE